MTTHDTPEDVLAAALDEVDWREPSPILAAAILAATPDWMLVPVEWHAEMEMDRVLRLSAVKEANAEIARLRAALDSTRGALLTVAQYDSWASEWLARHPFAPGRWW